MSLHLHGVAFMHHSWCVIRGMGTVKQAAIMLYLPPTCQPSCPSAHLCAPLPTSSLGS